MAWDGYVFDSWTELFEVELITCIKIDLALNNLQKLICYKIPTNQPTNLVKSYTKM